MSDSATAWTEACRAPLYMMLEFSRQEYWNGWPFPTPVESNYALIKNNFLKRMMISKKKKNYFSKMNITLLFGNNLAVTATNTLQPDLLYIFFLFYKVDIFL